MKLIKFVQFWTKYNSWTMFSTLFTSIEFFVNSIEISCCTHIKDTTRGLIDTNVCTPGGIKRLPHTVTFRWVLTIKHIFKDAIMWKLNTNSGSSPSWHHSPTFAHQLLPVVAEKGSTPLKWANDKAAAKLRTITCTCIGLPFTGVETPDTKAITTDFEPKGGKKCAHTQILSPTDTGV